MCLCLNVMWACIDSCANWLTLPRCRQREAMHTLAAVTERPDLIHLSVAMMSVVTSQLVEMLASQGGAEAPGESCETEEGQAAPSL